LAGFWIAPSASAATALGTRPAVASFESLTVGGLVRTYLLHVPSSIGPNADAPLLLVFHGHDDTAEGAEAATGFDQLADGNHFIVAYPQGYEDSWNDGRGTTAAELAGVNDVAFVRALVHQLERTEPIDPQRIYATGFSNGGMLTERLGCQLAPMFAAIAAVAGPIAAPIAASCRPARPLSIFEIQGTTDQVVPYAGGSVQSDVGGEVLSLQQTAGFWTQRDGCVGPPVKAAFGPAPNDGSGVVVATYTDCAAGTVVRIAGVVGGAHEWPGALSTTGLSGTAASGHGFYASPAIWRFLRNFSRTAA
jgi:polyhydroxybutyrate depolymerase